MVMKKSGPTDFLADRGWLSFTPPAFRKNVLARIQVREFRKGEAIYRAGDPPGGLWVVVKGSIELELPPPETAPHLVHLAATGFWFGEWPLIWDKPRRLTVIATRPSTLATLPLTECQAILKADPAAWRWIALLSTMTSDLSAGIIADLMLRDPIKRTAAVLLRVSGVRSNVFASTEPSPVYLSQERLGHLVNLSRNSIIPILRDFVRLGFIEVKYGAILINDVKALSSTIPE
jgi:CRP/FNR family transcriptional regulator, cyclic AMP receptor protein